VPGGLVTAKEEMLFNYVPSWPVGYQELVGLYLSFNHPPIMVIVPFLIDQQENLVG
jgi:hypothetical protein